MTKTYSVLELADIARCTRAQIAYYHEIRLLPLPRRAAQGAYEYDDVDLLRLQQIRMGRAAGLALEEIRRWLDRGKDVQANLTEGRCGTRYCGPIEGSSLYAEVEVKVENDADRRDFQEEADLLYAWLASHQSAGATAADARLSPWVERHRNHIDRWFCPCSAASHPAFARAIAQNPHLGAGIDRHGRNLRGFMLAVVQAHAA